MVKPFKTVSALYLSYYILSFVRASQFKIQKLVYYSDGWHLAYFERPLIDEDFEAWVHGPAVRSLWDYYKGRSYTTEFYMPPERAEKVKEYFARTLRPEQTELIGDVIREYGDKSTYHLEALVHGELPWREARNGYSQSERSAALISRETMKKYYQSLFPK